MYIYIIGFNELYCLWRIDLELCEIVFRERDDRSWGSEGKGEVGSCFFSN